VLFTKTAQCHNLHKRNVLFCRRSGALDPEKAVALGVRPGRAFAQLKAGQAVETAEGRTVEASEV